MGGDSVGGRARTAVVRLPREADYTQGFGGSRETSPGPLERVMSPLLRRMYPLALQRMLDTQGISRLKQIIRSRGWPGSLK
jgi:hypothetical protein